MGISDWIRKKREESRERRQWEKDARAEAMNYYKQQYKESLASSMKREAMNKAKREAKAKAKATFMGGGGLLGSLEGARSRAEKGLRSYSDVVGGLPIVQDIYGSPTPKPRPRKRSAKKKRKKRKSYQRPYDPFSLF